MKSALSDRIVGGKSADSAIPWQVSLRWQANTGEYHFCGGTILNANTVLSAAHCFPNGHQGIVVAAGAHKRSTNANVQVSYEFFTASNVVRVVLRIAQLLLLLFWFSIC